MSKKPIAYQYHTDNKKVCVCTAVFDGIRFKGTATCNPELDAFDKDIGFRIAQERCFLEILKYQKRCAKFDIEFREKDDIYLKLLVRKNEECLAAAHNRLDKLDNLIEEVRNKIHDLSK